MKRIYIRRKNEASGHVFKSRVSVKEDKVCILPWIGFVTEGFITDEEWQKSEENICDKLGLVIVEKDIDGRTKVARNMKYFSWKDIFNMKKNRSGFKPMGYKTISNTAAIVIEISTCGSMLRYRTEDAFHTTDDWNSPVSDWVDIHYDENSGEPYFFRYGLREYLNEYMKFKF